MKNINILLAGLFCITLSTSCSMFGLDLQKDYKYEKKTLDPHLNKSAKQYMLDRGKAPQIASDTLFKWMQLGLEYAGIDLSEYEQSGRTFIFLGTNAIRVRNATTGAITGGLWFDFPIYEKNPDGSQAMLPDGITPRTHPATSWKEYPVQEVRNYFLYLILKGDYGFNNATTSTTTLETLLPPGSVPGTIQSSVSRLGYVGFDPEGKIDMVLVNNQDSPLRINSVTNCTSSGQIATNGQVHVVSPTGTTGASVFPRRVAIVQ